LQLIAGFSGDAHADRCDSGALSSGQDDTAGYGSRRFREVGFACSLELLDLDVQLGSNYRSHVCRAIHLVRSHAKSDSFVLVNVGAGQVVQKDFRDFLQSEPGVLLVAVWCDERTFRSRHSAETRDRELWNNYGRC